MLEIVQTHLSVAGHVKYVVRHAKGLLFSLVISLFFMGHVDGIKVELFLLSVEAHILNLSALVALMRSLLSALSLDSSDIEALARHYGHILGREHMIVIVKVSGLRLLIVTLLLLVAVSLHSDALSFLCGLLTLVGAQFGGISHHVIFISILRLRYNRLLFSLALSFRNLAHRSILEIHDLWAVSINLVILPLVVDSAKLEIAAHLLAYMLASCTFLVLTLIGSLLAKFASRMSFERIVCEVG